MPSNLFYMADADGVGRSWEIYTLSLFSKEKYRNDNGNGNTHGP